MHSEESYYCEVSEMVEEARTAKLAESAEVYLLNSGFSLSSCSLVSPSDSFLLQLKCLSMEIVLSSMVSWYSQVKLILGIPQLVWTKIILRLMVLSSAHHVCSSPPQSYFRTLVHSYLRMGQAEEDRNPLPLSLYLIFSY